MITCGCFLKYGSAGEHRVHSGTGGISSSSVTWLSIISPSVSSSSSSSSCDASKWFSPIDERSEWLGRITGKEKEKRISMTTILFNTHSQLNLSKRTLCLREQSISVPNNENTATFNSSHSTFICMWSFIQTVIANAGNTLMHLHITYKWCTRLFILGNKFAIIRTNVINF